MLRSFNKTTIFVVSAVLILVCNSTAVAAIRHVNHAATGANNGTSWGDAYTQLQTALAGSTSGDEIWVVAGTYKPSTTGTRTQSFVVPSGVALYGGFNGTETLLTQRNVSSNLVILSGDLSGNDNSNLTKTEPTRLDNSHHVLQVLNVTSQCIIDGFTIQSGHAEITNTINERGAGILCVASVLMLNKCVLRSNYARTGAAFNDDVGSSNIAVRGCSFIGNQQQRGGTVAIGSTFDVRNSLFYQNRTSDSPDGYQWGGGLFIKDTTGKVVNCVFAENHATEEGGGVYNHGNTEFINCAFVRNSSSTWSTALHDRTNEAVIKNCVFWGNTGTGLVISNDSRSSGTPAFNAIIQGGYTAAGSTNILNSDPIFQDINAPLGADSIFGTVDDGLHLAVSSPAINAGNNSYVPAGVTVDAAESPRLYGTVDLGPYEKGIKINAHPLSATIQVTMDVSFFVSAEGNGTLAYQWRKDEIDIPLANSATLIITDVNKLDEGVYDVEISDGSYSSFSNVATLSVISPAIFTDPTSRSGYFGQSTTFNVLAAGTGTVSYQWRKNGVNIPTATSSSLTLSPLNYRSAADYDVVVTDDFDTATSDPAELTVLSPAPDVSISPGDTTVAHGGGLTFTATVNTGIPPYTYQWRKDGATIAKATNATLVLTNIQRTQEGVYDVVVKNGHGVDVSNPARLSVPPLVPVNSAPENTAVNPAGTATFTVNVLGATAWQWLKNGVAIKGANTSTLNVLNVDASSAGLYSVTVTTPNGKVTTAPAQLRINDSGLLIYKLTGTGKAYEGTVATNAALSGYLVLDRAGQRGGLIIGSKSGSQNIHRLEIHEDLDTQSTGPVPKSQTVVSELVAGEFALWMDGTDGLLTISKTDKAVGPATMKGFANSIDLGSNVRIETVSLTLALDAVNSTPARFNQETVEQAMSRISQDMQAKGSALVE
jgi:hypothetical protein